jgi:hypothetical protein
MVNGTVNTTAPQQCGVRRIHDRINIERRDISSNNADLWRHSRLTSIYAPL